MTDCSDSNGKGDGGKGWRVSKWAADNTVTAVDHFIATTVDATTTVDPAVVVAIIASDVDVRCIDIFKSNYTVTPI